MYLTGIDLGSRFVKLAVYDCKKKDIIKLEKFDTIKFYKNFTKIKSNELIINKNIFPLGDKICATGYGRNNINVKNSITINELKAHVFGIFYQTGLSNFTLVDIGGQDTKVVKVVDKYIDDFVMNDKCAASTGRYIENMLRILDVDFNFFSKQIDDPVPINSTCAIFGESEIIGYIAQNIPIKRICAGINQSLAKRIIPMIEKVYTPPLVLVGGVANNIGLQYFIKKFLKIDEIVIPKEYQFNGAIGCFNYLTLFGN